ncbi:uncharacterized protein [Euphorbia lathyris]|uniref:uncharacterized protein isoform X2 n=1 Tax=Euphorbia lathyris TaxID=212925 RepID=UPI003313DEE5
MVNARIDEYSPYYLHPSKNPSLVLVSTILSPNGKNYHSWCRSMEMALLSKNKLDFVDGTLEKPLPGSLLLSAWKRCNNMVCAWLIRSLDPSVAQTVLGIGDAKALWDNLKENFCQSDIFRIADLQAEIFAITQGDRSVTDFFASLQILWDEFLELKPLPTCVCEGCVCNVANAIKQNQESSHVISFLKGLNSSFSTIKSQIMVVDPLSPLNKVFSLVLQHEREFDVHNQGIMKQDLVAYVQNQQNVQGNRNNNKGFVHNKNSGKKCSHCGFTNHTVETCFKKHGYPPGYKSWRFAKANLVSDSVEEDGCEQSDGILGKGPNVWTETNSGSGNGCDSQQFYSTAQVQQLLQQQFMQHSSTENANAVKTSSICVAPAFNSSPDK